MHKALPAVVLLLLASMSFPQKLQHEATSINIEVSVRVFKNGVFVNDLTIKDFELYEEGRRQQLEAVYLISKKSVKREESEAEKAGIASTLAPDVSRFYVLLFELNEYLPKLGDAIDYFVQQVLLPGDVLQVVSPVKTYNFKPESFDLLPKDQIAAQLKSRLKKDLRLSSLDFKSLLKDYDDLVRLETEEMPLLQMKMTLINKMKRLKHYNEKRFEEFAEYLKKINGQKHIFFFYQKEMIPIPAEIDMNSLDYFELMQTETPDTRRIERAFADSSITSHFVYVTKPLADEEGERPSELGGAWMDSSAGIFSSFTEIAQATGGLVSSSSNAAAAFEETVEASENYYLLYYAPGTYQSDGKFKKIKVKVKNRRVTITHRSGYIAD